MALVKINGVDWLVKEQANEDVIAASVASTTVTSVMATNAEAIAGTDPTLGMNPVSLQAVLHADELTISTANVGTVYEIYGHLTASNAAISAGTIYGVRGEMTLSGAISAGGAYLAAVSAKLTITGTQNHAASRLACVFAKLDATSGTLTAGETSLIWADLVGITGIPFAEFNAIRLTANADAKFTSLVYAQADASFVFDWVIPTNGHNAFVAAAGVGAGSAGNAAGVATKVFLIRSSGVTYYVPMFLANT